MVPRITGPVVCSLSTFPFFLDPCWALKCTTPHSKVAQLTTMHDDVQQHLRSRTHKSRTGASFCLNPCTFIHTLPHLENTLLSLHPFPFELFIITVALSVSVVFHNLALKPAPIAALKRVIKLSPIAAFTLLITPQSHTQSHTHSHKRLYSRPHLHLLSHTQSLLYISTYICTSTHFRICTPIHSSTHTCTQTPTNTSSHTCNSISIGNDPYTSSAFALAPAPAITLAPQPIIALALYSNLHLLSWLSGLVHFITPKHHGNTLSYMALQFSSIDTSDSLDCFRQ